jgi:hypothetical protein
MIAEMLAAQEQAVGEVLKKHVPATKRAGFGRWCLALSNGETFRVSARIEDPWLVMEAPLGAKNRAPAGPERNWDLVRWNARLPGGAKFVLPPGSRTPRVRAEVLADQNPDLEPQIHGAVEGIRAAHRRIACDQIEQQDAGPGPRPADEPRPCDLEGICRDAGWELVRRPSGRMAVALDAPGAVHQAILDLRKDGRLAVSVEIAALPSPAAATRQAVGLMLLRASGLVRMARGAVEETDGRTEARFEVVFDVPPAAAQTVHDALAALSVACRTCGRQEVEAMQAEACARKYLSLRGWSS